MITLCYIIFFKYLHLPAVSDLGPYSDLIVLWLLVRNRWCRLYSWPEHACQEPMLSTILKTRTILTGTGGVDYIHGQNMLVRNRWCWLYSWREHACQEPVVSTIFMTRTCLSGTGGVDYIHDQNMLVRNRWCRLYSWPKHACQEPVVSTIHDQKMLVRNRWYRHFLCKMSHYQIQLWHSQLQICIPLSIRRGVYNSEPRNVTLYISYLATEWMIIILWCISFNF